MEVSLEYFKPADVDFLPLDASKARGKLGWKPRTWFNELVTIVVHADLKKENLEVSQIGKIQYRKKALQGRS